MIGDGENAVLRGTCAVAPGSRSVPLHYCMHPCRPPGGFSAAITTTLLSRHRCAGLADYGIRLLFHQVASRLGISSPSERAIDRSGRARQVVKPEPAYVEPLVRCGDASRPRAAGQKTAGDLRAQLRHALDITSMRNPSACIEGTLRRSDRKYTAAQVQRDAHHALDLARLQKGAIRKGRSAAPPLRRA